MEIVLSTKTRDTRDGGVLKQSSHLFQKASILETGAAMFQTQIGLDCFQMDVSA